MHREMSYSMLLPEDYYTSIDSFPVIYLLHGFGGNHNSWLVRCRINDLVDSLRSNRNLEELIFVMPDADNSYFINNYDSSYMFSDYLAYELVPAIDSFYRTKPVNSSRAIMGLSMGGYGAIINAMKHRKQFGSVIALSAAIRTEAIFKNLPQARYEKYFGNVFGPGLSDTARITSHWKENSPYALMDTCLIQSMRKINWYIDCGMSDFLLPANEEFHQLLLKNNIPHDYHVRPGKHNWTYWYNSTVHGLMYLNEKFSD
jgi:S-formylglutathione hydrolase FrmB